MHHTRLHHPHIIREQPSSSATPIQSSPSPSMHSQSHHLLSLRRPPSASSSSSIPPNASHNPNHLPVSYLPKSFLLRYMSSPPRLVHTLLAYLPPLSPAVNTNSCAYIQTCSFHSCCCNFRTVSLMTLFSCLFILFYFYVFYIFVFIFSYFYYIFILFKFIFIFDLLDTTKHVRTWHCW